MCRFVIKTNSVIAIILGFVDLVKYFVEYVILDTF